MTNDASFSAKPPGQGASRAANAFASVAPKPEPKKRLTVDLPLSLHSRIKLRCVQDNVAISDVVRELLEKRFPDLD